MKPKIATEGGINILMKLYSIFGKRWQREYLTNLRESHDCNTQAIGKAPKVGEVVMVYEEGVKRNGGSGEPHRR